jgi:tRNA-2-methylthio-N6-dimethylallyladenosine synthase
MHDKHRNPRPLAWLNTYGCQMNKNDTELLAGILEENGYAVTQDLSQANIALINTCSVRSHAERRALGRISGLAGWKRESPDRKIVVAGCMAQKDKDILLKNMPYIDLVMGPDSYRMLPELLKTPVRCAQTDLSVTELYSGLRYIRVPGISGWVTIMRGCDNFCSYCIVPFTRGRERSRSFSEIDSEIRNMVSEGFREVILLGQNVNSYRDGEIDFPSLLQKISTVPGLDRIRFMTSHPKDCSSRLFQIMASGIPICPNLHLPFQSGSDRILKLMNRNYTRDHFIRLTEEARSVIPDLAITTDVMVGFPGETRDDFLETCSLMEKIRFDDAYMYHYSPRPGTAAERMEDLPSEIKLERLNTIIRLQQLISKENREKLIGKTVEVLVEETSRHSENEWIGKTRNNTAVVFSKGKTGKGHLARVRINGLRGTVLRGSVLDEQEQVKKPPRQSTRLYKRMMSGAV